MIKRFTLIVCLLMSAQGFAAKGFWSNHAYLLIFSSRCPHCKVFAPVVKDTQKQVHFKLAAFSIDGHGLPVISDFANASNELLKAAFPDGRVAYPASFIVNTDNLKLYPIGIGALSRNELLERIDTLKGKVIQYEQGQKHA